MTTINDALIIECCQAMEACRANGGTWPEGRMPHCVERMIEALGLDRASLDGYAAAEARVCMEAVRMVAGWNGPGSLPIPADAIAFAVNALGSLELTGLNAPEVSPTASRIQVSFCHGVRELELFFDGEGEFEFVTVHNGEPQDEGTAIATDRGVLQGLIDWVRAGA